MKLPGCPTVKSAFPSRLTASVGDPDFPTNSAISHIQLLSNEQKHLQKRYPTFDLLFSDLLYFRPTLNLHFKRERGIFDRNN